MLVTTEGKLLIHQVDIDHIIGWFVDGDTLQEAIERELLLHGLEEKWDFNADMIVFDIESQCLYTSKNRN